MTGSIFPLRRALIALLLLVVSANSAVLPSTPSVSLPDAQTTAYIVQAASADRAAAAVAQAGGAVSLRLGIINGVAAQVDGAALARLQAMPGLTLHADTPVRPTDDNTGGNQEHEARTAGFLLYPAAATGAYLLHDQQVRGAGVGVAVVDSGFIPLRSARYWYSRDPLGALIAGYSGHWLVYRDFVSNNAGNSSDPYGHGTHVVSTIADYHEAPLSAGRSASPVGVAPDASMIIARALDQHGVGTYSRVIAAIDWIVSIKATYNIRVLNLSLYAPVSGPYWADPLDQAVMRAWQAGLVVVAAAGNSGPNGASITVPGNVPYVVTVGAVRSGRYNASGYDELAAYSSRGPTEAAFVKPDVVVPASRTIAAMAGNTTLAGDRRAANRIKETNIDPDYGGGHVFTRYNYYYLSGTSMAAAEVSGVAALVAQANPQLTNDQIKYRLLATAHPALNANGQAVYSIWEQGAGLVDAAQAALAPVEGAANVGLDVTQDLAGATHYWGNTVWNATTQQYALVDPSTHELWPGNGSIWSGNGSIWSGNGSIWSGNGSIWSGNGSIWSGNGSIWSGSFTLWTTSQSLWAGSGPVWAGSVPSTSQSRPANAGMVLSEP